LKLSKTEQMLLYVAKALPEELRSQVVFLGGSVVSILVTESNFPGIRPTKDVDLIINAKTRGQFHRFEESLGDAGFVRYLGDEPPIICRWRINSEIVDIMPCDENILGFSNKWYGDAIKNSCQIKLEDTVINVVTAPYFLATKIEAFLGRGNDDFMMSPDIEDIITIVDGRSEIVQEIKKSDIALQEYLHNIFKRWLKKNSFINALPCLLQSDLASQERLPIIIERIKAI